MSKYPVWRLALDDDGRRHLIVDGVCRDCTGPCPALRNGRPS